MNKYDDKELFKAIEHWHLLALLYSHKDMEDNHNELLEAIEDKFEED